MTWLSEACAHACPSRNRNVVTSGLFHYNSRDYRRNRVSDPTRARSLVNGSSPRAHRLLSPAFREASFKVPIWRIEQEGVVAAMSVPA